MILVLPFATFFSMFPFYVHFLILRLPMVNFCFDTGILWWPFMNLASKRCNLHVVICIIIFRISQIIFSIRELILELLALHFPLINMHIFLTTHFFHFLQFVLQMFDLLLKVIFFMFCSSLVLLEFFIGDTTTTTTSSMRVSYSSCYCMATTWMMTTSMTNCMMTTS